jgi:DnaJ homolog subfamily C member 19
MPYLALIAGLVFLLALYRFITRSDARAVRNLFLACAAMGVGLASLFLAVTGKLPVAIAALTALWPLLMAYLKHRPLAPDENFSSLSRTEAYEVLGLEEGADETAIREAHLRLIKKLHPDAEGSDWLARKINAARDLLLK